MNSVLTRNRISWLLDMPASGKNWILGLDVCIQFRAEYVKTTVAQVCMSKGGSDLERINVFIDMKVKK